MLGEAVGGHPGIAGNACYGNLLSAVERLLPLQPENPCQRVAGYAGQRAAADAAPKPGRRRCRALYARQYNQHEVDYKRAANTLFDGILTNSQLFVHLSKCHSTVLFIENI